MYAKNFVRTDQKEKKDSKKTLQKVHNAMIYTKT